MSPDQLKDAYNNLARQQGRTIYEDPQAWVNLGVPPFVSEEAGAAFMGKVPSGGSQLSAPEILSTLSGMFLWKKLPTGFLLKVTRRPMLKEAQAPLLSCVACILGL